VEEKSENYSPVKTEKEKDITFAENKLSLNQSFLLENLIYKFQQSKSTFAGTSKYFTTKVSGADL